MRAVDQTISSHVNGNCFEACVASILELPLDEVPTFVGGNSEEWFEAFAAWMATRGHAAAYLPHAPGMRPIGYHIGASDFHSVDGVRTAHAVVALDGTVVHCPHPSRAGLTQPIRYWTLILPFAQPICIEADDFGPPSP